MESLAGIARPILDCGELREVPGNLASVPSGQDRLYVREVLVERRPSDARLLGPSTVTVEQVLNDWLATVGHGLAPITSHNYQSIIAGRLVPQIGHIRVRDLRPAQITATYNKLRAPGATGERRSRRGAYLRPAWGRPTRCCGRRWRGR